MSTATTEPVRAGYWPDNVYDWIAQELINAPKDGLWAVDEISEASKLYAQSEVPYRVYIVDGKDANRRIKFIQYGRDASNIVLLDVNEPTADFPAHYQEAVEYLRANDRPILADKLVALLKNMREDPDERDICIISLRDMARCLVKRKDFADPSIGPDRHSMIYTQWRIMGDGVLVVNFLGNDEILLVAQADLDGLPVDASKQGKLQDILQEYEYLVPRRH